ncbi:MAG: hypothetical protein N3J91_12545 [Verrucomicrobiae bacterium]|nr:hypothetical protein [Verrucomicrobiae bacterium]
MPADDVHAHGMAGMGRQRSLSFKLPEGWSEKPAQRMRVAQIVVPGKDGLEAEISIVPLAGMTASREDILNIWREQLRLPAVDKAAAEAAVSRVEISSGQGDLYDLASAEPLIQEKYKMRILAAVYEQDGVSWFIKMSGPDETVSQARKDFLAFLKSLNWTADTPDTPPAIAANSPAGSSETAALPQWQVPPHWQAQNPPGPMLTAKFTIKDEQGRQAEVTVSALAGDGGGPLPNVNRWRGQLLLPPVTAEELPKLGTPVDVNGRSVTLYEMEGTWAKTGEPARMLVLSVASGGQTWFYKLTGDAQLAAREKEAFLSFVRSVKYPHAH